MGHDMQATRPRRRWTGAALAAVLLVSLAAACSDDGDSDAGAADDTVRYVLPPGNYGGMPPGEHSLDQLALYDSLTPLRGDIGTDDLEELFLPADFEPIEPTTVEETGRDGLEIVYDAYGIAHITGETREDVAFGAGWVTARDRSLLIQLALGPARAAVADVPGIDAFGLVTSGRSFVPSPEAEALVDAQWDLLVEEFGEEGEQIRSDAEAGAEGANAWFTANDIDMVVTPNDVLAATAFIGSIFGAGGGAEASNAEFLATLQAGMGDEQGYDAWNDAMLALDPEAPTTISDTFDYGPITGGDVTGSVVLDEGSIVAVNVDPADTDDEGIDGDDAGGGAGTFTATAAPPARQASNFLVANKSRSATGSTQAVMGPQLGYYYPEIVQQIHLRGPDFEAQGAAVPGLTMYMLIGRTQDYAWSLTSAGHDVRDVYAEELCEPDGSAPTRESTHYLWQGECVAMELFDAGTLDGAPIEYLVTEHGPVIGTATVDGAPVALSRKRSTFGRDGLNLVALKRMTEGEASTAEDFYEVANQFEFTFNWGWASRDDTAFFTSGRLPVRPDGLDRRLPTVGTGEYEWEGFLERDDHPHASGGTDGLILNWNNQSAPGFLHGDGGSGYGSIHRLLLFDQWPDETQLTDVVGVMNRAATEDVRSPAWPALSEVLGKGEAPSELAGQVVEILDAWIADDAPRLDADDNGDYDSPGPAIMDALFPELVRTVMEPVYGDLLPALEEVRDLSGDEGASYVNKDLRALLGQDVDGPFALSYCGAGDLDACVESLWATVDEVAATLVAELGADPNTWLVEAARVPFAPGLIPETIRWTNRPTYQQIIEWARD